MPHSSGLDPRISHRIDFQKNPTYLRLSSVDLPIGQDAICVLLIGSKAAKNHRVTLSSIPLLKNEDVETNVKSLSAGSCTKVVRGETGKMTIPLWVQTICWSALTVFVLLNAVPAVLHCQSLEQFKVQVSIGNTSVQRTPFFVKLIPSSGVSVDKQEEWRGTAGAGQVE